MAKTLALICAVIVLTHSCQAGSLGRIVGGSPAVQFQFPWHASLRIDVAGSIHQSFCGGTLISDLFILTAASCLRNAQLIHIDLGSILFSRPELTLQSTQFHLHGQFNANFNTNDIALIRLPRSIEFTMSIRPVDIPRQSQANEQFVNSEVFIPGFGVTTPNGNVLSENLLFANQRIITNAQCLQSFSAQFVQQSTVCAVGINNTPQTPCFGDRGGALVSLVEGTWTQIGISSFFHSGGCHGTHPAGYSRLTPHLQWISMNTGIQIPFENDVEQV